MPGLGHVAPPVGWRDLIKRMPRLAIKGDLAGVMMLDEASRRQLNGVFEGLRGEFVWTADRAQHDKLDHWAYPVRRDRFLHGDCEDFALEARRRLVERGWPMSALRICFCVLPATEAPVGRRAHVVLTAEVYRQGQSTLVLDNRRNRVMDWSEYGWELADDDWRNPQGRWLSRELPGMFWWQKVRRPQARPGTSPNTSPGTS